MGWSQGKLFLLGLLVANMFLGMSSLSMCLNRQIEANVGIIKVGHSSHLLIYLFFGNRCLISAVDCIEIEWNSVSSFELNLDVFAEEE